MKDYEGEFERQFEERSVMTTCDHGEIYHSAENDNYYCKQCHAGMGHGVYSYISQLKNKAASEIEALRRDYQDARNLWNVDDTSPHAHFIDVMQDCMNKEHSLRARVAELEKDAAELLKHSFHTYGCPYPINECTCGLGEIVKRHNTAMSAEKK